MSENVSKIAAPKQMKAPGWLNRKIRDTALGRLGWIEEESLTVEDSLGTVQLGKNNASLQATAGGHAPAPAGSPPRSGGRGSWRRHTQDPACFPLSLAT